MRTLLLPALALALALAVPAGALHELCTNTREPTLTLELDEGTYYVWDETAECVPDGCLWNVWIYQESNGIESMQIDDPVLEYEEPLPCEADTIIF